jgi:hypothetical protein
MAAGMTLILRQQIADDMQILAREVLVNEQKSHRLGTVRRNI